MSDLDRTEKNEKNAFLKLVKGKISVFPNIKADTEHLRIHNRAQYFLDKFKGLTKEQIRLDKKAKELYDECTHPLCLFHNMKYISIGQFVGGSSDGYPVFYKYVLHITQLDANDGYDFDFVQMIAKNAGYISHKAIMQNNTAPWEDYAPNVYYDIKKILECLDWTDVDHYYSPFYLEAVRRNNLKKFVVPSMEIEAESEEEARKIAASRLVVTSV